MLQRPFRPRLNYFELESSQPITFLQCCYGNDRSLPLVICENGEKGIFLQKSSTSKVELQKKALAFKKHGFLHRIIV